MKDDEWLEQYLRDIQSMVPPGRDVTKRAARRQRMVRLLRQWLEAERDRDTTMARA